jgi:hypothetical protein
MHWTRHEVHSGEYSRYNPYPYGLSRCIIDTDIHKQAHTCILCVQKHTLCFQRQEQRALQKNDQRNLVSNGVRECLKPEKEPGMERIIPTKRIATCRKTLRK